MAPELHFSAAPERPGFEDLLEQYVQELPAQAAALRQALAERSRTALEELLHKLAGSLGLYGYRRIEGACRASLARLRNGTPVEDVRDGIEQLLGHLDRVRARRAL